MRKLYSVLALALIGHSGASAQQSEATLRLLERNNMFEPAIIEVAENVYTANRLSSDRQLHDRR